jgi:hypothetical protein
MFVNPLPATVFGFYGKALSAITSAWLEPDVPAEVIDVIAVHNLHTSSGAFSPGSVSLLSLNHYYLPQE